ncbi:MAG: glycosyltransferase family 4 protein [Gemmatimonadetes bacterium]|nr:glycosyltransferase family 4 protein [Gemmatimonadota bacterium]
MAEALGRRGHDVHVVTYHLGEDVGHLPFRIHRIPAVPAYRRVSPGPTYVKLLLLNALLRLKLGSVVRSHPPDVIHAHHYEGLVLGLSLRSRGRPPVIYDAHTLLASELPFYRLGLTRRVKGAVGAVLDRRLPGRAAHVIAVSESIRATLLELRACSPDDVTVVGNGVEQALLEAGRAAAAPPGRTVVFAGNTAAYQGIDLLLRAFRQVRDEHPDVRLLIVTDGRFDPYEALARELGIRDAVEVVNAGFEEMLPLLASADVTVNPRPASGGGSPQKLMNYMAAAAPIVSFEGSAAHLQHGNTAWIVGGRDAGDLARGILRMLDDRELASRLGEAARRSVAENYSWERTAEGVEAVYSRVLGGTGSPAGEAAAPQRAGIGTP